VIDSSVSNSREAPHVGRRERRRGDRRNTTSPSHGKRDVRLADLLDERCVLLDTPVETKEQLFQEVIRHFESAELTHDPDAAMEAILKRERVMSTGIGEGVAIPHAQSPAVAKLAVGLVRPRVPIEFDAADGRPVGLVFVILGPEERGGFVRVLARISRLLYDGELSGKLLTARSPKDVISAISRKEEDSRA
jgi:mannitol/fructose-specific phosphotransferase system IIA component (Ntr-type)